MPDWSARDKLITLLFDAATDPPSWGRFLEALGEALGSHVGGLHVDHFHLRQSRMLHTFGMDEKTLSEYTQHYAAVSPYFLGGTTAIDVAMAANGPMLCPDDVALKTEYYNDYLRPLKARHMGGEILGVDGRSISVISLGRSESQDMFGEDDLTFLSSLLPHIQSALRAAERFGTVQIQRDALAGALDLISLAVVLLDGKGQIAAMNRAARAILNRRDALSSDGKKLKPLFRSAAVELERALALATKRGSGPHRLSSSLIVPRATHGLPYRLSVIPLGTEHPLAAAGKAACAIFIADPDHEPRADSETLRRQFGLTKSEARAAALLMQGKSVREIAGECGVQPNTIRIHLKRIFGKTGTSGQSQLVRLLMKTLLGVPGA